MKPQRGLTLIELVIVLAILGTLAVAGGVYINTAEARLRSFVFNLGSRFKQARYEAVMKGRIVYMDFDPDDDKKPDNGYTIWVDKDGDGKFLTMKGDYKLLPDQAFPSPGPVVYDIKNNLFCGGPKCGPRSYTIGDGVSAGGLRFKFDPGGSSSDGIIYVCSAEESSHGKEVVAGPWAIIVDSAGRIRIDEWRNGKWQVN